VVNPAEAEQVRAIFKLYLRVESLVRVAQEANARGLRTKAWTTEKGEQQGGKPFDKARVNYLLTNVAYLGQVQHKEDVYPGEHEAILDQTTWDQVQAILARNAKTAGAMVRNKHGALLKGLLRCKACDAAMVHSAANRQSRQYRYYVCTKAQKNGHASCGQCPVHRTGGAGQTSPVAHRPPDGDRLADGRGGRTA
jgi:site-specific DNA recombinase